MSDKPTKIEQEAAEIIMDFIAACLINNVPRIDYAHLIDRANKAGLLEVSVTANSNNNKENENVIK